MATLVLNDADIYLNQTELSCQANSISIDTTATELDATTFCSGGWKETAGGFKSWKAKIAGFTTFSTIDLLAHAFMGGPAPMAFVPEGSTTINNLAYFGKGAIMNHSRGGDAGELAKLELDISGTASSGLKRGLLLAESASRSSGTGNLAVYDYGASISSTATIYAWASVTSASGGSGDFIKVYSSSSAGFGTSTQQFSFDAQTGGTNTISSVTGVTHRYWRVQYSLTNACTFFVCFAVV